MSSRATLSLALALAFACMPSAYADGNEIPKDPVKAQEELGRLDGSLQGARNQLVAFKAAQAAAPIGSPIWQHMQAQIMSTEGVLRGMEARKKLLTEAAAAPKDGPASKPPPKPGEPGSVSASADGSEGRGNGSAEVAYDASESKASLSEERTEKRKKSVEKASRAAEGWKPGEDSSGMAGGGAGGAAGGGDGLKGNAAAQGAAGLARPKSSQNPSAELSLAAVGGGFRGSLESLGFKAAPGADGSPSIVHRDGRPASAAEVRQLEKNLRAEPAALTKRPDFYSVLPREKFKGLKISYEAKPGQEAFRHMGMTDYQRDFVWSESCSPVSGGCNSHSSESYQRGGFVDPEVLRKVSFFIDEVTPAPDSSSMPSARALEERRPKGLRAIFSSLRSQPRDSGSTAVSAGGFWGRVWGKSASPAAAPTAATPLLEKAARAPRVLPEKRSFRSHFWLILLTASLAAYGVSRWKAR